MITGINKSRSLAKDMSSKCKCKFDGRKSQWKNDKCQCKCKKQYISKKFCYMYLQEWEIFGQYY